MKKIAPSRWQSADPSAHVVSDSVPDDPSNRASPSAQPAWEGLPSRRAAGCLKKAAAKLQAAKRGHQVRQQVQIASQGHGVVSTTIRAPRNPLSLSVAPGTFVSDIQQHLQTAATFTRVSVSNGTLGIHGTHDYEVARAPQELAQSAAPGAAVINGSYFAHKTGLQTECGETIESLGCPVGQVAGRRDFIPVPGPWLPDYATITANDETILSGAPLLALDGKRRPIEDADRFHYRIDGKDNPLNRLAGALTHSSDANERSAVSLVPTQLPAAIKVILHTLTTGGNRKAGATMAQWQTITELAAQSVADALLPGHGGAGASTLNLDGGGSVFLGVRQISGVKILARGGLPDQPTRPVANVMASEAGVASHVLSIRPYRP
ncbi:hypothetical protein WAE31_16385 (plasmid) [Xanthomonas axonopodis pv. vasculorum]